MKEYKKHFVAQLGNKALRPSKMGGEAYQIMEMMLEQTNECANKASLDAIRATQEFKTKQKAYKEALNKERAENKSSTVPAPSKSKKNEAQKPAKKVKKSPAKSNAKSVPTTSDSKQVRKKTFKQTTLNLQCHKEKAD